VGFLKAFVERGYRGKISLQCRAELITDDFLAAASRLNVTLEFGLQTIHTSESDAVNRRNKIDKVDEALRKVRALGIHHEVSLIFGLPTQTLDSFRETVDWCLKRQVPVVKAFPLMLLRGTQLAQDASRWNLRESGHAMPFVISSSTFTEEDWAQMNAISEALKATEGRHPESIEQLPIGLPSQATERWVVARSANRQKRMSMIERSEAAPLTRLTLPNA
jgi:coproporphyrinogen III oxidase-like Fe-S oxidoreductase